MRSSGTVLCAAVAVATGACVGGASAATLLAQNRVVESNASASDGVNSVTDPRMDQSIDPGVVTLEIHSYSEALDAVGQCAVGQESSDVGPDLISHFTRVDADATAASPGAAGATGRSLLHVTFRVTTPEFWSLGYSFAVYNPATPGASMATFILERDGTVLRAFETQFGLDFSDAMTLAPGDYTLSLELTADVASDGVSSGATGSSVGLHFQRYDTPCPGDTNGDRRVDFVDLNYVLAQYGLVGAPGSLPADVNDDGAVNFVDLNIVLSNYANDCPA